VEELNNKRVVLAGLCKLFSYGIFEMRLATVLFSRIISVCIPSIIFLYMSSAMDGVTVAYY
jgi:hypothetical protein